MQVAKVEPPAVSLAAAVLAHEAVEPALHAARQLEIRPVDGQHERVVKDGAVEPIGDDQFDAARMTMLVSALGPFVDPGEAMHSPLGGLAQGRGDRGGLETIERRLEPLIVA